MMKKLITLILCLFVVLAIDAQRGQTVIKYKMDAATVYGTSGDTTELPLIHGEYDVSVQLWPAIVQGDSLNFSFYPQLSASYDNATAWTTTSAVDSVDTATDADAIIWYADMKPLRLRLIYTGLSTDTISITPYVVYKKHRNE